MREHRCAGGRGAAGRPFRCGWKKRNGLRCAPCRHSAPAEPTPPKFKTPPKKTAQETPQKPRERTAPRAARKARTHQKTTPQGEDRRRGMQLWRWMYADDRWAGAPEDTIGVQNGFSPAFCEKIRPLASMDGGLRLEGVARARDGTRKLVFRLTEGEGRGGWLGGSRGLRSGLGGLFRLTGGGVCCVVLCCVALCLLEGGFGACKQAPTSSPAPAVTTPSSLLLNPTPAIPDPNQRCLSLLPNPPAPPGGSVEAVLIPVVRGAGTKPRITLCVSSQVRARAAGLLRFLSITVSVSGLGRVRA